ncbi:MAG: hypothetical protein ACM3SY_19600 [Candidatus Omnitrophota bacterium]
MKKRYTTLFFTFLLLWIFPDHAISGQNHGMKYSRNFTITDYMLQPQNWWITQDQRGLIYIANQGGVLKYDGVSWETIPIPHASARSLAVDSKGRIFVGGIDELGFLKTASNRKPEYESLTPYIDNNHRSFGKVFETYAIHDVIYFRTLKYIFRWNAAQKQMKIMVPPTGAGNFKHYSQICGNELLVNCDNRSHATEKRFLSGHSRQRTSGFRRYRFPGYTV